MQKTLRGRAALGVGVALLALTGCSAPPPPEPEVLTASKAGGAYLAAVCPVNAAWDQADAELEQLRLALSRGDAKPDAVADALNEVAAASKRAAARLDPKETTWPSAAQSAIAAVRETLVDDRAQALKVAKLSAAKLSDYAWSGAEETAAAAAAAHEALDLPADGDAACAQWEAQEGVKRAQEPDEKPDEKPTPDEKSKSEEKPKPDDKPSEKSKPDVEPKSDEKPKPEEKPKPATVSQPTPQQKSGDPTRD